MVNKTKITGTRYVLAVKDLKKAVEFYKDKLGFSSGWAGEGWHFIHRDQCMIMLGECPEDMSAFETNNHSYFAYIEVNNIDVLFEEYKSKDIEILSSLQDKSLGQREFSIRTVDGHRIMFGEEIAV